MHSKNAAFPRILPIHPDVWRLLLFFLVSRLVTWLAGIHLDYGALARNWQYLDLYTLRHNLLRGVWYDPTQPPVFNLLLGGILKLSGSHSRIAFALFFKAISLLNACLIWHILRQTLKSRWLPLLTALLYLLSPACIVLENDLFYTSLLSALLLLSCLSLLRFWERPATGSALGFFLPLVAACLTRSMYHIVLLLVIFALLWYKFRSREVRRLLIPWMLGSLLVVGIFYVKNYLIFKSFTTSTWMGMNLARNVFHDAEIHDSSNIESIEPFSKLDAYRRFLSPGFGARYAGLNDRDLLAETKNDTFLNVKQVGYMNISHQYLEASKQYIRTHPLAYGKNVLQSGIIFFAPATRYPVVEFQARKMKYYDVLYSFNLSHFANGKQQRRIALMVSALPKLLAYLLVFACFAFTPQRSLDGKTALLYLFITCIITYIFCVSSLFEHFENMRFRYEIEPLFLLLAGGMLDRWLFRKRLRQT
jgi:hypothetical protein